MSKYFLFVWKSCPLPPPPPITGGLRSVSLCHNPRNLGSTTTSSNQGEYGRYSLTFRQHISDALKVKEAKTIVRHGMITSSHPRSSGMTNKIIYFSNPIPLCKKQTIKTQCINLESEMCLKIFWIFWHLLDQALTSVLICCHACPFWPNMLNTLMTMKVDIKMRWKNDFLGFEFCLTVKSMIMVIFKRYFARASHNRSFWLFCPNLIGICIFSYASSTPSSACQ